MSRSTRIKLQAHPVFPIEPEEDAGSFRHGVETPARLSRDPLGHRGVRRRHQPGTSGSPTPERGLIAPCPPATRGTPPLSSATCCSRLIVEILARLLPRAGCFVRPVGSLRREPHDATTLRIATSSSLWAVPRGTDCGGPYRACRRRSGGGRWPRCRGKRPPPRRSPRRSRRRWPGAGSAPGNAGDGSAGWPPAAPGRPARRRSIARHTASSCPTFWARIGAVDSG